MKSHDRAGQLALRFASQDLNEADTRHQLIDPLLHDVFGWPRNRVHCEEYVQPGYADYVLVRPDESQLLFIEAKREGHYFALPNGLIGQSQSAYIKVRTLLTDDNVYAAVNQVRNYCINTGCEYAAITNGHQWIFFKTFQIGQDWREVKALVINGIDYFSSRFIEAHNIFSYQSIAQEASLRRLFLDGTLSNRELFYPKDRITVYDAPVDANGYASSLRPIADKYFGAIDATDAGFMENCYVSDREYDLAFTNAKRRLEDAVTPFLQQFKVREFRDSGKGGGFGNRISKNLVGLRPADVVVLFGGKGVGKSTFLRRLLIHKPPQVIAKNGVIVLVDLLAVEPNKEKLELAIWTGIESQLDGESILQGNRDDLCQLFSDRFKQAKNQDLFGLDEHSEAYNVRLNDLVSAWKADHAYVTKCLAARIRARHKAIIVTIDNTDHHDDTLQEFCFSVGQSIASAFPCVVIISMREERFYSSSIRGVLDAYQNSGFHISSPEPREVFLRRIRYVRNLLQTGTAESSGISSRVETGVVDSFLAIMGTNFRERSSHLSNFITACSHGNIRLALELFRGFVVSGYTNVREMTNEGSWTLQIHQVIKPFMIPSRFFYSESLSRIPNTFQIRSKAHGSHFTALRILSSLLHGHDRQNPPFIPIATLSMPFIEAFAMKEDFQLNMDMLLKHNLIEANNRLDKFDEAVDSIKITTYGMFMLSAMSHDFTYLELTAEDCAIGDLGISNQLAELSNDEYRYFMAHNTMARVEVRLERADLFLKYLESEEDRERQLYRSPVDWQFTRSFRDHFTKERIGVLKSARRNVPKKLDRQDTFR
jgi:hypothetical protein